MIDVKIKAAGIEDIDTLIYWRMILLKELYGNISENVVRDIEIADRKYYSQTLADGTHIACLAILDGKVIGCGGLCIQQELPYPDNLNGLSGFMTNIYIVNQYRHLRIGHDIVKWLIEQAEMRSITKIYLETSKLSRNLYESMGFVDMDDMMELKQGILH